MKFGDVIYRGGKKTGEPGKKDPRSKARTNNKLNQQMASNRNRTRTTCGRRALSCSTAPEFERDYLKDKANIKGDNNKGDNSEGDNNKGD